jgi:hypothetical protein
MMMHFIITESSSSVSKMKSGIKIGNDQAKVLEKRTGEVGCGIPNPHKA